jgi:hypothetical protein
MALVIKLVNLSGIRVMDHGEGIEALLFEPGQVPVPDVVILWVCVQVDAVIKEAITSLQEGDIRFQVHRDRPCHLGIGSTIQHQIPNFMSIHL